MTGDHRHSICSGCLGVDKVDSDLRTLFCCNTVHLHPKLVMASKNALLSTLKFSLLVPMSYKCGEPLTFKHTPLGSCSTKNRNAASQYLEFNILHSPVLDAPACGHACMHPYGA